MTELPYRRDTSAVFSTIATEPWSIFLDSSYPYIDSGRYDIFACRPNTTVVTFADKTTVTYRSGETEISTDDPFQLVKDLLGEEERNLPDLPFCGGAMGYFAYDLGRRIEHLPENAEHDINIPDMAIGIYDWAVIVDHQRRRTWLGSNRGKDRRRITSIR